MKKAVCLFFISVLSIAFFTGCSNTPTPSPTPDPPTPPDPPIEYVDITLSDNENLEFTDLNDESLEGKQIEKNSDFEFYVVAATSQSLDSYVVPDAINVYIGESSNPIDDYEIEFLDDYHSKAKVSVDGEYITDDISIKDNSANLDKDYKFKVWSHFHLNCDITEGTVTREEGINKVITFTREADLSPYSLPSENSIYIKVDEGEWLSLASDEAKNYCSYETTGTEFKLSIKPAIKHLIDIKSRAANYFILNDIGWDEISEYSTAGLAEYYFCIGDTKMVEINGHNGANEARIIDFNHDTDGDGKPIGITFEFKTLICNGGEDEGVFTTDFSKTKLLYTSYKGSKVAGEVTSIYNNLPTDLHSVIKPAHKFAGSVHKGMFGEMIVDLVDLGYLPMFLLSATEYSGFSSEHIAVKWVAGEGTQYKYYEINGIEKKNRACGGTDCHSYWTRSVTSDSDNNAVLIDNTSTIIFRHITSSGTDICSFAIAPAFCV